MSIKLFRPAIGGMKYSDLYDMALNDVSNREWSREGFSIMHEPTRNSRYVTIRHKEGPLYVEIYKSHPLKIEGADETRTDIDDTGMIDSVAKKLAKVLKLNEHGGFVEVVKQGKHK